MKISNTQILSIVTISILAVTVGILLHQLNDISSTLRTEKFCADASRISSRDVPFSSEVRVAGVDLYARTITLQKKSGFGGAPIFILVNVTSSTKLFRASPQMRNGVVTSYVRTPIAASEITVPSEGIATIRNESDGTFLLIILTLPDKQ
ncbi:hypothetical protein EBR66_06260 [bacterium]|nr:hypothetical protein [bacterium]